MIIWMDRPLANDHLDGPASCKWNDPSDGPTSCKWSSRSTGLLQMTRIQIRDLHCLPGLVYKTKQNTKTWFICNILIFLSEMIGTTWQLQKCHTTTRKQLVRRTGFPLLIMIKKSQKRHDVILPSWSFFFSSLITWRGPLGGKRPLGKAFECLQVFSSFFPFSLFNFFLLI